MPTDHRQTEDDHVRLLVERLCPPDLAFSVTRYDVGRWHIVIASAPEPPHYVIERVVNVRGAVFPEGIITRNVDEMVTHILERIAQHAE